MNEFEFEFEKKWINGLYAFDKNIIKKRSNTPQKSAPIPKPQKKNLADILGRLVSSKLEISEFLLNASNEEKMALMKELMVIEGIVSEAM